MYINFKQTHPCPSKPGESGSVRPMFPSCCLRNSTKVDMEARPTQRSAGHLAGVCCIVVGAFRTSTPLEPCRRGDSDLLGSWRSSP